MALTLINKNHKSFLKKLKRKYSTCKSENENRVVFGKESYKLQKEFEKDNVNDFKWRWLRAQQRLTKIKEFQNVCMSGNYKDPGKYSAVSESSKWFLNITQKL